MSGTLSPSLAADIATRVYDISKPANLKGPEFA